MTLCVQIVRLSGTKKTHMKNNSLSYRSGGGILALRYHSIIARYAPSVGIYINGVVRDLKFDMLMYKIKFAKFSGRKKNTHMKNNCSSLSFVLSVCLTAHKLLHVLVFESHQRESATYTETTHKHDREFYHYTTSFCLTSLF